MNIQIATIEANVALSRASMESINRVAGQVFDNGAIEIDFHGVHADVQPTKTESCFS